MNQYKLPIVALFVGLALALAGCGGGGGGTDQATATVNGTVDRAGVPKAAARALADLPAGVGDVTVVAVDTAGTVVASDLVVFLQNPAPYTPPPRRSLRRCPRR